MQPVSALVVDAAKSALVVITMSLSGPGSRVTSPQAEVQAHDDKLTSYFMRRRWQRSQASWERFLRNALCGPEPEGKMSHALT